MGAGDKTSDGDRRSAKTTARAALRVIEGVDSARSHERGGDAALKLDWSELMKRAQDGDKVAYEHLMIEMTPYLRSLAAARLRTPSAIEDAVQDVLMAIHALRHTYDPARPFEPWLVTIARRRVIDAYRREARRSGRETVFEAKHETFAGDEANFNDETADRQVLLDAIEKLPPNQRDAIRLLKLEERSLKEAAAMTGLSIATLKVSTHRAIRKLKQMFETQDE